jgi:hypothetical protein
MLTVQAIRSIIDRSKEIYAPVLEITPDVEPVNYLMINMVYLA